MQPAVVKIHDEEGYVVKNKLPLLILCFFLFLPSLSVALTLDEALLRAERNLPSYKAALIRVKATEALYKASLSPYLPALGASATYNKLYTSLGDFNTRQYDVTLSYTLYDWGNRSASRDIALSNLSVDREEARKGLLDIAYLVRISFYTSVARKETVEQRKVQLQDAQKDYEVAEGRYKSGVAKLSDVLQASVRLEQARFNVIQAEGEFNKTAADLSSLIGDPLDTHHDIQGSLDKVIELPEKSLLFESALQRPEIRQAESSVKIAERNRDIASSSLYPVLATSASYNRSSGGTTFLTPFAEEKVIGLTATWNNIFDIGKLSRRKSSSLEKDVSREKLSEIKRQVLLDVQKDYEDFATASKQVHAAQEQLKQAEYNYAQAFGEYKAGKADILSLVQAESLLSNAREQMISCRLGLIRSKTVLERTAGMDIKER